jgi:hypothetical protein
MMKNMAFLGACLLVFSALAFAQTPDSTGTGTQNTGATQNGTPNSGRKTVTMTGCVMQRNGQYYLITNSQRSGVSGGTNESNQSNAQGTESGQQATHSKRGREIQLTGNQDMQQYVGQTVSVTGRFEHNASVTNQQNNNDSSATEPNDKNGNTASQSDTTNNGGKKHHAQLQVSNVQPVSNSCTMNNGGGSGTQPR